MTAHPTDRELSALLDGTADPAIELHVPGCAYCRSRLALAGPPIEIPNSVATEQRELALPLAVSDSDPERGDVWRLAWDHIRELALVLELGQGVVTVAPLLLDREEMADDTVVPFEANASDLGIPFGVNIASHFALPLLVFDARLARIGEDHSSLIEAAIADRHASRSEAPVGRPPHGALDPRIDALGELVEAFETLTDAKWAEVNDQPVATDWLAVADLGLVDTYRLYELANGVVPEPSEVAAASEHGLPIAVPGLDGALVAFLDLPRNSSRLRGRATRSRRPETSVRLEAATTLANRRVAMAARGGDGSFDWSPLFEEYLDETRD